jgi:hypothetical protein
LLEVVVAAAACSLGVEECVGFLLERSPAGDRGEPNLSLIVENVEMALRTRKISPGGYDTDSVFLAYVLPARGARNR